MEILVIGDSWAAGREAETGLDVGWPALLGIPPGLRQGRSGSTAAQWAADHEGWLSRARATPAAAVVVSLLGNDGRAAAAQGARAVHELEAGLTALRAVVDAVLRPLTIVMLYADPFDGRDPQARVAVPLINDAIRAACEGRTVAFAHTAHWLGGGHFDGTDIHPTRAGHAAIARGLRALLDDHRFPAAPAATAAHAAA